MVMTHFYQKNVFESCLKISARLRAEILQIRVKTGHFGVKNGPNHGMGNHAPKLPKPEPSPKIAENHVQRGSIRKINSNVNPPMKTWTTPA